MSVSRPITTEYRTTRAHPARPHIIHCLTVSDMGDSLLRYGATRWARFSYNLNSAPLTIPFSN